MDLRGQVSHDRTILQSAGSMLVLGCNTIGHLAAGLEHIRRIGDDSSGHRWERTRRMGVNALAFRLPQHQRVFVADADCIPSTPRTSWDKNRQFLDLVARSGSALFVSIDPESRSHEVDNDVRRAIERMLHQSSSVAEPLDWVETAAPSRWRFGDERVRYDWQEVWGTDPVLD